MIVVMTEGEQYENDEEWEQGMRHQPQLRRPSPRVLLANITPIRQVAHPLGDTTDYEELAMVLY